MDENPDEGDPKSKEVDRFGRTFHWFIHHHIWGAHIEKECRSKAGGKTEEKKKNNKDPPKDKNKYTYAKTLASII